MVGKKGKVPVTGRTGKKHCTCGFKKRGQCHETGVHHKTGKKLDDNFGHGVKTNVGDPLNNR